LKLTNKGSKPILLIEGEELRGAKQNRIVNASFLIMGMISIRRRLEDHEILLP
jgi:hypothetical protein